VTLREELEDACFQTGLPMKELTVLAVQRDPFRVDTPAGHRDGRWLAEVVGGVRDWLGVRGD
jgi:hypothetical protein